MPAAARQVVQYQIAEAVGPHELAEGELVDDEKVERRDIRPDSGGLPAAANSLLLQLESHRATVERELEVGRLH